MEWEPIGVGTAILLKIGVRICADFGEWGEAFDHRLKSVPHSGMAVFAFVVVSGLCWFPTEMRPAFGWPAWLPPLLTCLAACACSALMTGWRWLVAVACWFGVSLATLLGFILWPEKDPVAEPWVPILLVIVPVGAALLAAAGAAVGCYCARWSGRYFWIFVGVLAGVGILCSTAVAANGPLVTFKIRHNRPIAERRVRALYRAATLAIQATGEESSAQHGAEVRRFYRGPRFDDGEWGGMTRNDMRENGFVYQIHLGTPPAQGVVVYAVPIEYEDRAGPGLCLDQTGRMECPLLVISGQRCVPCSR